MYAIPLEEFDIEMKSTRRLLERIPSDKGPWKPHERSFSIGHLAQLVSDMPRWITETLQKTAINLSESAGYTYETTETLLKNFDNNVKGAREALASVTGTDLDTLWSLLMGEQVLFSTPRRVAVRQHLNHLIHHRAQLTVYLRLLDIPVPSIYGPTADESWASIT
jgi:uncharacterized damage-inducible protein DinB